MYTYVSMYMCVYILIKFNISGVINMNLIDYFVQSRELSTLHLYIFSFAFRLCVLAMYICGCIYLFGILLRGGAIHKCMTDRENRVHTHQ